MERVVGVEVSRKDIKSDFRAIGKPLVGSVQELVCKQSV